MAEEIEKFEITDWDIENEFNPDRIKRKLSKKQQIYGIWASDDSDDERPSFGGKGKKDFTAPINFISGGFRQNASKEKKETETDVKKDSSEEDEASSATTTKSRGFQKSGFSRSSRNNLAGLRSGQPSDKNFGGWEKHTKGIGQKILLQMGFEPGKGLGKKLQGITTPIEATKRQGKGAIGLYGPETPAKPYAIPSPALDNEEEDKTQKDRIQQWKKGPGEVKKNVKYVFRTMDEVASEGVNRKLRGDTSALSKVKVIDMTGPEQRVLSGYHQIHQQHNKPEEQEVEYEMIKGKGHHFALPELAHNLNLLVDMTENEIIRNDRELQHENDRIVNLKHEEQRLKEVLNTEEKQLKTIEEILIIIDSLDERTKEGCDNPLTLEDAAIAFKKIQENYYLECKLYGLADLANTIIFPVVKKYVETWDPLKNPSYGLEIFKKWKDLLEMEERRIENANSDPYHQLMWEVWMPCIRKAVSSWNARNYNPLIELIENWMPLLPPWIMNNILDQLVFPNLKKEVEDWNPVTDTLPIHLWLHPWLPLMGDRLEPLYASIRHKLAVALTNWHPSDRSAKLILQPWRSVFSTSTMEAFVVTNIVPKLALVLQNFVINPHQQHLDAWKWIMDWEDMIPESCMVPLLEKNFFPRWLQVLCTWLNHNPNYEEVTKWYMGWKSMFSDSLLNNSVIKDQFKKALDIMNRAVSNPQGLLGYQPGARESVAYLANLERQKEYEIHADKNKRSLEALVQTFGSASSTAQLSLSFKDLIQRKAEENNVLFMPVPNRYQEGKQVYSFGRTLMYIDRGVIFVFNDKMWVPTSLQSLLDICI